MTRTSEGAGPLAGLRVLDVGHQIAGPYCARMLADQGADVIKVERPGCGDISRTMGPFVGSDPHPEKSLTYLYLNYNKRSVTLDLGTSHGRSLFRTLVRDCDVLIENFEPRVMRSFGLDFDGLAPENPGLVYTSISNFGQGGPRGDWRGNDLTNYAMSGVMSISGTADREPLKHGYFQSAYVGGLCAVIPTMAALLARDATGQGQHVDVSISEALASTLVLTVPYYTYMGEVQSRRSPVGDTFGNCARASDGWVIAHSPRNEQWAEFCELVDAPELNAERFSTPDGRLRHAEELDSILGAALRARQKFELFHSTNAKRMLFGVVQTPEDLALCPQLRERTFFHEVEHPVAGTLRYPGQTFETSEEGFSIRRRAPLLGEHTEEVLGAIGCTAKDVDELRRAGIV